MARLIAAETGTAPEVVLAEAAEIGARRRAAGAHTVEETAAFLAAELGVTPEVVLAETRALLEAVR
jgi:hypothetical protein